MKKTTIRSLLFFLLTVLFLASTFSENALSQSLSSSLGVAAYPSKGQSADQQNKEEGECFAWAKQQTGIDPIAAANAPAQKSGAAAGGGERLRGAAKGAAAGAAVGAIADDEAGKGAAAGAAVGTVAGGRKARKNKEAQQQQAEQAKTATLDKFNKSFGACMEGKGYTVK